MDDTLRFGGPEVPAAHLDPRKLWVDRLNPGDIVAFALNPVTGSWEGPVASAPVRLTVACVLTSEASTATLASAGESTQLVSDARAAQLATDASLAGLTAAAEGGSLQLNLQVDSLLASVMQYGLCADSTLGPVLHCMTQRGFLTGSEVDRLLGELRARGFSAESRVTDLLASRQLSGLRVQVDVRALAQGLRSAGAQIRVEAHELNWLVYQLSFATGQNADSLRAALGTLGFVQRDSALTMGFRVQPDSIGHAICPASRQSLTVSYANVGNLRAREVLLFVASPSGTEIVRAQSVRPKRVAGSVARNGTALARAGTGVYAAGVGAALLFDAFRSSDVATEIRRVGSVQVLRWRIRRGLPPGSGGRLAVDVRWQGHQVR